MKDSTLQMDGIYFQIQNFNLSQNLSSQVWQPIYQDIECSFHCTNNVVYLFHNQNRTTTSYKKDLRIINEKNIIELYGCFLKNVAYNSYGYSEVELSVDYFNLLELSINQIREKKLKRILGNETRI